MANRFCTNCGAKLMTGAAFCAECGERQPGAKAAPAGWSLPVQRYAPLFVVLTVVAIAGGVIFYGSLTPKVQPSVPGRGAAAQGAGALPENHPPITVPNEVKQAITDMAQKAAAAPDDLDTWKRLAEVQYRAGQLDPRFLEQAAASYRHVLEREPNNLDVLRALGNVAFDQQHTDTAVDFYQRYLKQKPDDLDVQTDLGTMYLSAGKTDEAIKVYDAVLKTNPSFFQAQFNLALAYRSQGQPEKTIEALEKARTLAPDDRSRTQVDRLLARAKGAPPSAADADNPHANIDVGGAPPGGAAPAGATFQTAAEALFRQNPILGPKVARVEWTGAQTAKVYLREFPIEQMGEEMRVMFADRMKGRIKEQKDAHKVADTARFELVDEASGRVLETITE